MPVRSSRLLCMNYVTSTALVLRVRARVRVHVRRPDQPRAARREGGARGHQVRRKDRRAVEARRQVRQARRRQGFAICLYLYFYLYLFL